MATGGWSDVTRADLAKLGKRQNIDATPKRSKYGAKKTVIDNITFDSAKEANRYGILKMLSKAGKIDGFECQPVFPVDLTSGAGHQVHICNYIADFRYWKNGECVVEDVKSRATATPLYKLKKKLVEVIHDQKITEV